MKRFLSFIPVVVLQTASFGQSLFQQHTFADGLAIQVPTNWKILDASITQQLAANAAATTGNTQGNNKILIAANLYLNESTPSATVRLSVRHGSTLTERQFQAIPEAEFQEQTNENRTMVEQGLRSAGFSLITYSEQRETLAGHTAHTSIYVSAEKGRQILNVLSIIFLGDRKIKLHVTYDKASEATMKATVDRIRASLTIP